MANVCLSHSGPGLLRKGSGSTGACAARAVRKPVCNSHLQGDDIPAPGEGSFAQLMPVTSILCWLTQGGTGQPAASPGAWKRPRCQCWCESRAPRPPCCPCSLGQYLPPCPAPGSPQQSPVLQVLLEQVPQKGGQQAAALSSLWTFAPAGTPRPRSPTVEGISSPHCPGCQGERGMLLGGGVCVCVITASAGGRCVGSTPGAAQLLLPAEGQTAPVLHPQARVMPGDASA